MPFSRALILGAGGAVGRAIYDQLSENSHVIGISSQEGLDYQTDYSEDSLADVAEQLEAGFDLLVTCNGFLHDESIQPEKRLAHITQDALGIYFQRNVIVPALCLKYFTPLLRHRSRAVVALISARVGSIADNGLGGWYGYRCSKAALNMLVRNAAIELGRFNPEAVVAAIHPGTTVSNLSKPFMPSDTRVRSESKLPWMQPRETAANLLGVMEGLESEDNGSFLDWRGERIPF